MGSVTANQRDVTSVERDGTPLDWNEPAGAAKHDVETHTPVIRLAEALMSEAVQTPKSLPAGLACLTV